MAVMFGGNKKPSDRSSLLSASSSTSNSDVTFLTGSASATGSLREKLFKPTGKEKKGIKGQAFGVGAFEEEDDDIYHTEQLSSYDVTMCEEDEVVKTSHTSKHKQKVDYQGVLTNFEKCSIQRPANKRYPPPRLPANFIPKHKFPANSSVWLATLDVQQKRKLSAKERSLMLAHRDKGVQAIKNWALRWDQKPTSNTSSHKKDAKNTDKVVKEVSNKKVSTR
jgi:G patch domain-containing protein 1